MCQNADCEWGGLCHVSVCKQTKIAALKARSFEDVPHKYCAEDKHIRVFGKVLVATCSCGAHFFYADDASRHHINGTTHRWVYVPDVRVVSKILKRRTR